MTKTTALLLAASLALPAADNTPAAMKQRNEAYGSELEQYFRDYLVTRYPDRAAQAWHRSYDSPEAFLNSVKANRERYRRIFSPPNLTPAGPLERKPLSVVPGVRAEWL